MKSLEEQKVIHDMGIMAKEIKNILKENKDKDFNSIWINKNHKTPGFIYTLDKFILKYGFLTRLNPKAIVKDNLIPTIFFKLPDDSLCNSRLMLQPRADIKQKDKAWRELHDKGLAKYCDLQPSNCGYYFGRAVLFDW